MSNPNPPAALPRGRALWLAVAGLALALYGAFLARNFSSVAGGADSSGYLNSARLLAAGRFAAEPRVPPEFGPPEKVVRQQFQPHGFVPFDGNPLLSPTYAPGLPLHLALAGTILGWSLAPVAVGVGGALAALVLCYAVARGFGLGSPLAAAGAAALAGYPVFIFMSIQPLSDTLATVWCLAAILAAQRAATVPAPGWALACGAAVGVAVLVRTTNILIVPAAVALLGLDVRRLGFAVLGGAPAALWLGYYNHTLYGGALQTGYVNISEAFGWRHSLPTAVHFAQWLALMLPAALVALPAVALVRGARPVRTGLALGLWFGAFAVVYAFYEISREVWWDLRFILPGTPALIIGGLVGLDALAKSPRARVLSAVGIALWSAGLGWFWTKKHHLLLTPIYERDYADASAAAREKFPPGTLVIAGLHSGSLFYYTDLAILRWEFVPPADWARLRALAENAGRPIGAVLFNLEEKEALRERCTGPWTQVAKINHVTLWRLAAPAP
ncbi:MAG: glycosyltransferase family 39 protein [Opitutaceae bacterium]|nr:glycosyltransferase family 39 protein [Opitutaceae bacterium]